MNKRHLFFTTFLLVLGAAHTSSAALNLSVSPLSGGTTLRFGRVSSGSTTNREVRVRVTNTGGAQYQVFHRVIDQFVNEENAPLAADAMSTYTLIGSNALGTLYAPSPERLGFTDQLLYSSGQSGDSDSFTVVYALEGGRLSASGNYLGRIQFFARPVGGPSQDSAILNVTIEASGEFKFTIEGSEARDAVRLSPKNGQAQEGFVQIDFKENLGNTITVYQEAEAFPQDELFNELAAGVVLFAAAGSSSAELQPQTLTPVMRKRTQVYTSKESKDSFRLNFALDKDKLAEQKAGTYQGTLRYIIDDGGREEAHLVRLTVEVEPVFLIEVDLPPQGLTFERLLPDSPPIVRQLEVEVRSNLGKPYIIMQNVASPLTNGQGTELPQQYFTYKGELAGRPAGKLAATDFVQVPGGETSLFISDNQGSPSRFNISYRLRPFPAMVPGDYTTSIRYSLGEL